jgi:hypothetical protein
MIGYYLEPGVSDLKGDLVVFVVPEGEHVARRLSSR